MQEEVVAFRPQTDTSTSVAPTARPSTSLLPPLPTQPLAEFLSQPVGGSAAGTTSITQIVHHATPQPTSEYEFAHRIGQDVQQVSEPHLLVSILKVVEKRIGDLQRDRR